MARKANQAQKLIRKKIEIEAALNRFTRVIGIEAKNHFIQSFANQGFTDRHLVRWRPRRRNSDPGRAILIKSGDLRRSIRVISTSMNEVTVGSNLPYAQIHNDGGRMGRRGRMPRRQFIGESQVLNRRILYLLDKLIKRKFANK